MTSSLRDRVAVVTGASSGIGEATARALAREGSSLGLIARRADRLENLRREFEGAGASVLACDADVRDTSTLEAFAKQMRSELGPADCIVNNAGVMLLSEFSDAKRDEWHDTMETNVLGAMDVTSVFLPQLLEGGGDIVNISSVAGRKARPTSSVYSSSKWALNGWSEGLRQELADKDVRVIVVEPGAARTELAQHISDPEIRQRNLDNYDLYDALTAEDIADVIVFAVSRPRRVSVNEVLIRPTKQVY
jgi:NADP-dependent 3-hydroxy acid dehydrogenase YdfG